MTTKNEFGIAVLLPTRGRTEALSRSVISLINRCVMLDRVQILFGFDTDDEKGKSHFQNSLQPWLDEKGVHYTALEFEPMGYERLNEYVNALGMAASADWMFFWNDDAIMESTGWDREIINHTGEFKLLAVHTHRDHPYSIFPIVPHAWMDQLGYLSPHALTDAWTSQIAYKLNIWERIPVYVTHDRHDLTGNNDDETYRNRVMFEGDPNHPRDFHHPHWIALRMRETDKLSQYMQTQGLDVSFWENIKLGKQDPWAQLKTNDVNKQMTQFNLTIRQ